MYTGLEILMWMGIVILGVMLLGFTISVLSFWVSKNITLGILRAKELFHHHKKGK